jgi:hypothetical protein
VVGCEHEYSKRLAIAHPFTYRELARIVQIGYDYPIDHQGIQCVLEFHTTRVSIGVMMDVFQVAEKGRMPSVDEMEAKQQELIRSLPSQEEFGQRLFGDDRQTD